jgi:hypothetical protein
MSTEPIEIDETEIISVNIPYVSIPSPPNTIEIETEETEVAHNNEDIETTINSTNRKNSWVWSFYNQVKTFDGDVFTICNVKKNDGTTCDKCYKTKGSTGNLINYLLNHGITKDNQHPLRVCKIIIISYFYCFYCILILKNINFRLPKLNQ